MKSRMGLPRHLEHLRRASSCSLMMSLVVSAAFVCAGCASSQGSQGSQSARKSPHEGWLGGSVSDSMLSGSVYVCSTDLRKCSPVAATVTVLSVHGTTMGGAVAKQHTATGRFSFALPPGKYVPSVPDVQARLSGGRCVASEAVVRARENVSVSILCPRGSGKSAN